MRRGAAALWAACAALGLAQASGRYETLAGQVDAARLKESLATLSGFAPRLAGTRGERKAIEWAKSQLQQLGCRDFTYVTSEVAIPDPDAQAEFYPAGSAAQRATISPLWPNLVSPSTIDVTAELIDGQQLEGHDVAGKIALYPFGSEAEWRKAAMLGAAAIVFYDDGRVDRYQAELKVAEAPIRVPRFFAERHVNAKAFLGRTMVLRCRQNWIRAESQTLVADLPGELSETVLLGAYADSMSVVPALNPGAQQGSGLAALIETVRVLRSQPRKRSLRVVLFGGHFLGLRGARDYVQKWLDGADPAFKGQTLVAGITLDLSTGSRSMGSFGRGWFYEARDETLGVVGQLSRLMRDHSNQMWKPLGLRDARECLIDTVNNSDGRPWKNTIPGRPAFDCEPFVLTQTPVLTFATTEDARQYHDTPYDTLARVDISSVTSQTQRVVSFLDHLLNDPGPGWKGIDPSSNNRVPNQPASPRSLTLMCGFATVTGRALIYDPKRSFVPDSPVENAVVVVMGRSPSLMGVRGDLVTIASSRGDFQFDGLPLVNSYRDTLRRPIQLGAYRLDGEGRIDMAPTQGLMGSADYPLSFMLTTTRRDSPLVMFPCQTVDIIGSADPQTFGPLAWYDVLDARTHTEPNRYGVLRRFGDPTQPSMGRGDVCAFLDPGQKFVLTGRSFEGELRLLLNNSGRGYQVDSFPLSTDLAAASDLLTLNRERLSVLAKYRILSTGVDRLQQLGEEALSKADEARTQRAWGSAERLGRAAWGFALRAYPIVKGTANDLVNGVVFYLFLLIPFSYFAERLLIAARRLVVQIAGTLAIFFGAFLLLRWLHPAFEIVPNPSIIFIAFVMAALSLFVGTFLIAKFDASMRQSRREPTRPDSDVKRTGVAIAAFQVGISNMRRRRLRTALTTLTLVVMTFIVLAFTSIVPDVQVQVAETGRDAAYDGVLVRLPNMAELSPAVVQGFQSEFGSSAKVARRVAYYGAEVADNATLTLGADKKRVDFRAIVGLDANEPMRPTLAVGRWFEPGESGVVVLAQDLAKALEIGLGQSLEFAGSRRTLIGTFDAAPVKAHLDLDGDPLMPPDFSASKRLQQESGSLNSAFLSFVRLDPAVCAIMPADDALALGGAVRSVSVLAPHEDLETLMLRLRLNLYASVDAKVKQFSSLPGSKGAGFGMVLVQMVIAAFFVLNTMIAGVYERRREIGILSSIGFAPNHIGMLFFAESAVYGVLGAVIGYFAAQGVAKWVIITGALPNLNLNFSATSAVLSAATVMGVVLLSTIYPARIAARIAAPARDEALLREPPEGDEWAIALPFTVSEAEARRVLAYFAEWFSDHERFTVGGFVTEGVSVGEEAILATAWLAPFDLGVSQRLELVSAPGRAPGVHELTVHLTRLSGEPRNWARANGPFLEAVRRQFLAWSTTRP